jgi:hypothetical protein
VLAKAPDAGSPTAPFTSASVFFQFHRKRIRQRDTAVRVREFPITLDRLIEPQSG